MLSPRQFPKISRQARTVLLNDAGAEPVTSGDYQAYMKMSNTAITDAVFNQKARGARRLCEKYSGLKFVSQQFSMTLDLPPGADSSFGSILSRFYGYIPEFVSLLHSPFRQISQITVTDDTGAVIVVPPSSYWASQFGASPGRFSLRDTQIWPDTLGRSFETFTVTYTVGLSIPYTAGGTVCSTLQPHGLVDGQAQRIWTTSDGKLPLTILNLLASDATGPENVVPEQDFFVLNPSGSTNTFGLAATKGGSAIDFGTDAQGTQFIGAITENLLRAILATAAVDFFPAKSKTPAPRQGALPDIALELLGFDKIYNL